MTSPINPQNIISLLLNHYKLYKNVSATTIEEIQLSKHISSIIDTAIKTNVEIEFSDELEIDDNANLIENGAIDYDFGSEDSEEETDYNSESSTGFSQKSK